MKINTLSYHHVKYHISLLITISFHFVLPMKLSDKKLINQPKLKYCINTEKAERLIIQIKKNNHVGFFTSTLQKIVPHIVDNDLSASHHTIAIILFITTINAHKIQIRDNFRIFKTNNALLQRLNPDAINALINTLNLCEQNLKNENKYYNKKSNYNNNILQQSIFKTIQDLEKTMPVECNECNHFQQKKNRVFYCVNNCPKKDTINNEIINTINQWLNDFLGINGICYVNDNCHDSYMAVSNTTFDFYSFNLELSKNAIRDFKEGERGRWDFIQCLLHEASHLISNDLCVHDNHNNNDTMCNEKEINKKLREFRAEMLIPTYKNSFVNIAKIRFYTTILICQKHLLYLKQNCLFQRKTLADQKKDSLYPSILEKYINSRTVYAYTYFKNPRSVKLDLLNIHPSLAELDDILINSYKEEKNKMFFAPKLIANIKIAKQNHKDDGFNAN